MFARTDRLLLRPGWAEDAPALATAISHERVMRNLARAPWPYEAADASRYLAGVDGPLPSFLIFARTDATPRLVGGIGLGRLTTGEVELGYWIAPAFWNRGYATEAGHAVLALARDSLRSRALVAGHFADNPASGRVLEKLGFTASGPSALRYSRARGEAVPFVGYALDLGYSDRDRDEPERTTAPRSFGLRQAHSAARYSSLGRTHEALASEAEFRRA